MTQITHTAVAALALLLLNHPAHAGVVYNNDFDSSIAGFVETADADWTHDGTGGYYHYFRDGASSAIFRGALIEVPQLGGSYTRDFVIKTRVNQTQQFGGVGLIMLADTSTLTSSTHHYGAYYGRGGGGHMGIILHERNVSPNASTSSTNTTFGVGGWTDLTVVGTYQGDGSLRIDFYYKRGALEYHKALVDPTPATGQYFGLFGYKQAGPYNFPVEADFDYLTIESSAIPTPAAAASAPLLLGLVASRRRRR